MQDQQVDAYLQPVHDEFVSEYPPACSRRVAWLSGFSGSAGAVAVTKQAAALFTDGRYSLQARSETPEHYEHFNSGEKTPETWLAETLKQGQRAGYDPGLYTSGMLARLRLALEPRGIALQPVPNLVDAVWQTRPPAPASELEAHPVKYSGEAPGDKRRRIAEAVRKAGADTVLLTSPDSVCWLLDIRASDVENTPLVLAPALLGRDASVRLFVDARRCGPEVAEHLGDVALLPPVRLEQELRALSGLRIICDPASVPVRYTQLLTESGGLVVEIPDPCLLPKACKNDVQLAGIRAAHIRDGAAVTRLLCWMDSQTARREVRETEVCDKLLAFRREDDRFRELSFPTISGSGPNGAVVHYRVSPESDRALRPGELFLLDSGGQYPDGTTDITRTVPVTGAGGKPSGEQKDRFTRVLKGHIALALAMFPTGTTGSQLDALARQYLWQAGLDYDHGTGHGVGQFLGVHEGPQRISKRGGDVPLAAGMVISNEPGYYKAGEYGIRIENLVAVVEKPHGGKPWLGFETLTCAPIDTRLVDTGLLAAAEREWLNAYHGWVAANLSPRLDAEAQAWLQTRCQPI